MAPLKVKENDMEEDDELHLILMNTVLDVLLKLND